VPTQDFVDQTLLALYQQHSHLLSLELHECYFVQVLAQRRTEAKEAILIAMYEKSTNQLVKRLIIQAMANWKCHYWLTDLKKQYATLSPWEKRSMIVASYVLAMKVSTGANM